MKKNVLLAGVVASELIFALELVKAKKKVKRAETYLGAMNTLSKHQKSHWEKAEDAVDLDEWVEHNDEVSCCWRAYDILLRRYKEGK